jgi:hypothetical protein
MPIDFFLRSGPNNLAIELKTFRKHASLLKKDEESIKARIREWLERYLLIEDLLGPDVHVFDNACSFSYRVPNTCIGKTEDRT